MLVIRLFHKSMVEVVNECYMFYDYEPHFDGEDKEGWYYDVRYKTSSDFLIDLKLNEINWIMKRYPEATIMAIQ